MRIRLHSVRAIVILAVLAILIVTVTAGLVLWDLRLKELGRAMAERDAIAELFVKQVKQDLNNISLGLKVVQERMQSPYGVRLELDSPEVFLLLGARAAAAEPTSSMFITNSAGVIVNTSLGYPPNRLHVADREYFKAFSGKSTSETFISRPLRNRIDNKWTMYFSCPLRWEDGRLRGVLVAAVPPSRLKDLFATLRLGTSRKASLHMTDGTLIASQTHSEEQIGNVVSQQADGVDGQVALRDVKGFPMYVKVGTDEVDALAAWRETALPIAFGSLAVCLSIAGLAIWLTRDLVRSESLRQALVIADERHTHTVASVMDAIIAIDDRQNIVLFNPAAERMFGLSAANAIGRPLDILIPESLRERHQQHVRTFLNSTRTSEMMAPKLEIFGLRANGEQFPIEATISRMTTNGTVQMTAVLRDITARREAERKLREANWQLRVLSGALQEVREEERTHLSRELHDELGQQLTGLKLDLTWLATRIREGRSAEPERVVAMRQLLDNVIASVRRISSDLRPPVLDDLGFCEAVRWLKEETEKRSGLVIEVDIPVGLMIRDSTVSTSLYRIVQEALTNTVRHAEAAHVLIRLAEEEGKLFLTIRDNGNGADLEHLKGGIGLASMRERAVALGGELDISGARGQGVTIKASIPIQQRDKTEEEK